MSHSHSQSGSTSRASTDAVPHIEPDEIVSQIIFRSQGRPTHSQLNSKRQSTLSQAGKPKSPPSVPRGPHHSREDEQLAPEPVQ